MAISNQVIGDLSMLVAEHAPDRFQNTINLAVPIIGSKALQKEDVDGEEYTFLVFGGGRHSTTFAKDFGLRPKGGSITPKKGRAFPTMITTTLAMGKLAALAKLSDAGKANLLDAVMEEHQTDAAWQLGRGIFGGAVSPAAAATWSGTAADSTVSVTFTDVSLFKPGRAYDFLDASASRSYVVRCVDVVAGAVGSFSANVAGTVSFINDVPDQDGAVEALTDTSVATGDTFRLRGETAGFGGAVTLTGAAMVSYDDICGSGSSASLHGLATNDLPGWTGQQINLGGPYNQEAMAGFMTRIQTYAGEMPTHVIMSPQAAVAHGMSGGFVGPGYGVSSLSLSAQRPMQLDRSMDKYGALGDGYEGSGLKCSGKDVIIDPNLQATRIILHNTNRVKLAVWQEMEPEEEGGNTVFNNRQTLSLEAYVTGAYQLVCKKRNSVASVIGLTAL